MLNLGDVNFNVGADTTGLSASIATLQRFGSAVDAVSTRTVTGARQVETAMQRQERATLQAANATLRLVQQMSRVDGGARFANQASSAFRQLSDYMTSGTRSTLDYNRALAQFRTSQQNAIRGFKDFAAVGQEGARTTSGFAAVLKALQSSSVLVTGPLGGVATRISTISALANSTGASIALFAAGFTGAVIVLYKFTRAITDAGIAMNKFQSQFEAVTGNMPQAIQLIEEAGKIANQTGQQISSVAPSFARFTIAATDTGLSMKQVETIFTAVSAASTKLQLSTEESEGVFRALEQMLSKGTVQSEELRGQLGDRLPGAFNIMARALGVTTAKLNTMLKAGDVLSADALPKFAAELMKTLNIDASTPVDNWTASVNRLSNAWFNLGSSLNDLTGSMDFIKRGIDSITAALNFLTQTVVKVPVAWQKAKDGIQDAWISVEYVTRAAVNVLLDVFLNLGDAVVKIFSAIPFVIGDAVVQSINTMVDKLNDALTLVDQAVTDHIGPHSPIFSAIPHIANPFEGAAQTAVDEVTKSFQMQHQILGDVLKDFQAYQDYMAQIERYRKNAQHDHDMAQRENGVGNAVAPFEIPGAGKPPSTELTDKQTKALQRQQEALQKINDEIERVNEEVSNLGSADKILDAMTEKFKRDKEVEKYATALRKAGVDTATLTAKTKELAAALEQRDALMHAREAMLELRDSMVDAFDTVTDSILNAFESGENAAEAFKKAVVKAINEVIDEMLKLLIFNPLKNWLFGTNLPTFDSVGAMGGALGQIFGSGSRQQFNPGSADTFLQVIGAAAGGGNSKLGELSGTGTSPNIDYSAFTRPMSDAVAGGMDKWAASIRYIESGSYGGNYRAIGPELDNGDRAIGAYQVMRSNIGDWSQKWTGNRMTTMQFLNDPAAQDKVFQGQFGMYANKWGPGRAANAWFTGSPGGKGTDVLGTTSSQYVEKFNNAMKNAPDAVDKMSTSATGASRAMAGVDTSANGAMRGLANMEGGMSEFAQSLKSFMANPQGGGSSWFQGLMGSQGGIGGAFQFMYNISPGVTDFILGGGAGLFSSGGIVGATMGPRKMVDPRVFNGAPHFMNGGVVGDEVPIIAHRGERVVPKGGKGGGDGLVVNNYVYNNTNATVRTEQRKRADGGYDMVTVIDDMVADRINRGGSMIDKSQRRRYGLKPQLSSR